MFGARVPALLFLEAVAEIGAELVGEFLLPVGCGSQSSEEEAEHCRLFYEFEAAYQITVVVQPFYAVYRIFYLRQGIYAAGYGQTQQFEFGIAFCSVGFALLGD